MTGRNCVIAGVAALLLAATGARLEAFWPPSLGTPPTTGTTTTPPSVTVPELPPDLGAPPPDSGPGQPPGAETPPENPPPEGGNPPDTAAAPEPATLLMGLLGAGGVGVYALLRRKQK